LHTPAVTVVIPTLAADSTLVECARALEQQTFRDFETVVVDNSGRGAARASGINARFIDNTTNVGFGAAINQAIRASASPFIACLNDDAAPSPDWLSELVGAITMADDIGMCASQVRLTNGQLDSAGMLICADASSKQRGHGAPAIEFSRRQEVLLPSGSAALYRREMLDEVGLFDEDFFLYCEDTDLGLRARWGGWRCLYVPGAVVEHRYSHSAGRASALKAYFVERNRLYVLAKNFPARVLWQAPVAAAIRYMWHVVFMFQGRGAAAAYRAESGGASLPWIVVKAHGALIAALPALILKRRAIRRRLTPRQFARLLTDYSISPKRVAAL
jgi:GT2 family glycosyltransferase